MSISMLGPTSKSAVGTPMGLGCEACPLLELCGGTTEFDCYGGCCGSPDRCSLACPRADNWVEVVRDAGGMEMRPRYAIKQQLTDLPIYVPHIHHGSSRTGFLSAKHVALTTFNVTSPDSDRRFNGPADLRRYFRLAPDAELILISIAKDNRLEHHWRNSASRNLARYLATLGIKHITAPNFSFPLDVPRPEHLVNRSRSLWEAERFTAQGLSVIPHVNAFNRRDWEAWLAFFRDHPHLSIVSQEFQTGLASRTKAKWHIWQLREIEQSLGRPFRLVAIGGRRHLPLLVGISAVTIIDANPFHKAHARQKLVDGRWVKAPTQRGLPIDELLEVNLANYANLVGRSNASARQKGPLLPDQEPGPVALLIPPPRASSAQLTFWPSDPNVGKQFPAIQAGKPGANWRVSQSFR
jgi:hypothetical protein